VAGLAALDVEDGLEELDVLDGLDDVMLLGVELFVIALRRTKPPPALLSVACCTQPVIVTGEPYVLDCVVVVELVVGVCEEGDCDEGDCGVVAGVCASATLADSTTPPVHRPVLIIRVIDIDPPTHSFDDAATIWLNTAVAST